MIFFAKLSSPVFSPRRNRVFSYNVMSFLYSGDLTSRGVSSKYTFFSRISDSLSAIILRLYFLSKIPSFGLPKCEMIATFAPFDNAYFIVGIAAKILASLTIWLL